MMDIWQDISTAPRDGTRILVWIEPGHITVGYWLTESHKAKPRPFWGHELYSSPSHARRYPPTRWMPLPAPPFSPRDRANTVPT